MYIYKIVYIYILLYVYYFAKKKLFARLEFHFLLVFAKLSQNCLCLSLSFSLSLSLSRSLARSLCLLSVVRSRAGMSPWIAGDNEVDINEALLQFSGRANTVTREGYNGEAGVTQAYRSFSLRMARLTRYLSEAVWSGRQFDQVSFARSQPRWTGHAKQSMGRGKIRVYIPQYQPRPVPLFVPPPYTRSNVLNIFFVPRSRKWFPRIVTGNEDLYNTFLLFRCVLVV